MLALTKSKTKFCPVCKTRKKFLDFGLSTGRKHDLTYACRKCINEKARKRLPERRDYYSQRYQKNKTYVLNYMRQYATGWALEDFDKAWNTQKGHCAICDIKLLRTKGGHKGRHKRAMADHNHTTKQKRGLLCQHCNSALGMVKENSQILKNMISYLAFYKALDKQ